MSWRGHSSAAAASASAAAADGLPHAAASHVSPHAWASSPSAASSTQGDAPDAASSALDATGAQVVDESCEALGVMMQDDGQSFIDKLHMINACMDSGEQRTPALRALVANYLVFYPVLLSETYVDLSAATAESDALLRSCINSLHRFVVGLSRAAMTGGLEATNTLLQALQHVLSFVVHAHPLVAEFGRSVWMLLHHSLDAAFHRFALRVTLQLLQVSCGLGETDSEASQRAQDWQWEWKLNAAQSQLVELLAQVAPLLAKEEQLFLLRHFNVQLLQGSSDASSPLLALHVTAALPLAMLSAFLMRTRVELLHADVLRVLYQHTFAGCVSELAHLRGESNGAALCQKLPVVCFCLEMLTAAFRAPVPAAAVPPHIVANLAAKAAPEIQALLPSLSSRLAHGGIQPEVQCAVMEGLLRCAQQDAIQRRLSHTQWGQWASTLQHHSQSVPSMRFVLGEALVALATVVVPPEAQGNFFSRTLKEAFAFLLTPPVLPPSSGSSVSLQSLERSAHDAFFRFTALVSWTRQFKDLIPSPVRPAVVAYVLARSKEQGVDEQAHAQQAATKATKRETIGEAGAGTVGGGANGNGGVEALQVHLTAERTRLEQQASQAQAEALADAHAARLALGPQTLPTLEFAAATLRQEWGSLATAGNGAELANGAMHMQ